MTDRLPEPLGGVRLYWFLRFMMRASFLLTTSIVSIVSVAFITTACVSYNSLSFVGAARPQPFVSCQHAFFKHAHCIFSDDHIWDQEMHLSSLMFNNISSFWGGQSPHGMEGTPHFDCMHDFCIKNERGP